APRGDVLDALGYEVLEEREGNVVTRVEDVDEVMRDPFLLGGRDFRGTDVHASVKGAGIGVDDLTLEAFGKLKGKASLADRGGTDEDDQDRFLQVGGDGLVSHTGMDV